MIFYLLLANIRVIFSPTIRDDFYSAIIDSHETEYIYEYENNPNVMINTIKYIKHNNTFPNSNQEFYPNEAQSHEDINSRQNMIFNIEQNLIGRSNSFWFFYDRFLQRPINNILQDQYYFSNVTNDNQGNISSCYDSAIKALFAGRQLVVYDSNSINNYTLPFLNYNIEMTNDAENEIYALNLLTDFSIAKIIFDDFLTSSLNYIDMKSDVCYNVTGLENKDKLGFYKVYHDFLVLAENTKNSILLLSLDEKIQFDIINFFIFLDFVCQNKYAYIKVEVLSRNFADVRDFVNDMVKLLRKIHKFIKYFAFKREIPIKRAFDFFRKFIWSMLKNITMYEYYWITEKHTYYVDQIVNEEIVECLQRNIYYDYGIYHRKTKLLIAHKTVKIAHGFKWRGCAFIEAYTKIHMYVSLGRLVYIGNNSEILHNVLVGDFSWFSSNNYVTCSTKIGKKNFFSDRVQIGDKLDEFLQIYCPKNPKAYPKANPEKNSKKKPKAKLKINSKANPEANPEKNEQEDTTKNRFDMWNIRTDSFIFFHSSTFIPSCSIVKFNKYLKTFEIDDCFCELQKIIDSNT
ncbi:hypothetical protein COBT_000368 [Conglomerata obtusa]